MGIFGLRVTDQETARVVAIHQVNTGTIVGAGCLVSDSTVLTCRHVVARALDIEMDKIQAGPPLQVTLSGVTEKCKIAAVVQDICKLPGYAGDIALLRLLPGRGIDLRIPAVEFAAPLRHSGKSFFVLGFPSGSAQGLHASGTLHGADAYGLVQMDGRSPLLVQGGFSGAPIWSPEVGAFLGLVVADLEGEGVAWCIPSRLLCSFYPDLLVRFRIPSADRPKINDYTEDDPNIQLFGSIDNNGSRKLTATVEWDDDEEEYTVIVTYKCLAKSSPPRGGYVTFITYPGFGRKKEDSYELFARIEVGEAKQKFNPKELFTVAAIGDGGDTALTLDLSTLSD